MFNSECKYKYVIEYVKTGHFIKCKDFNKECACLVDNICEATHFDNKEEANKYKRDGEIVIYVEFMVRKVEE